MTYAIDKRLDNLEGLIDELQGKHGSVRDALVRMDERLAERLEEATNMNRRLARLEDSRGGLLPDLSEALEKIDRELQAIDTMAENLSNRIQTSRDLMANLGFGDD